MAQKTSRRTFIRSGLRALILTQPLLYSACSLFKDFDIIVIGALLIDGSGKEPFVADLAIKDGKLMAIGDLKDRSAVRKIDAAGLTVAPGFIDFHSHSDDELLLGGEAQSKVRQGVTTEILGQDGGSVAPLNQKMRERMNERLERNFGINCDWHDFAGYFRKLQNSGLITNALSMIGQGTLRHFVVGLDNRAASPEEIAQMQQLAEEAFAHGAYGISSGLEYTPGSFADTEEIIALCKTMNGRGIYSTHMRNEDDTLMEALGEAIAIATGAGVDLNISHLKASGQRNWHKLPEVLDALDQARSGQKMRVSCDRYPYVAYNTGISSLFPLWSREGGSLAFVERLQSDSLRDSIRSHVLQKVDKIGGWQSVMISSLSRNEKRRDYEGKTMQELISDGRDAFQLLTELVIGEKGGGGMVGFAMSEENTAKLLAYPHCMIASDASAKATSGVLHSGNPHPRGYGSFPRVLGKYVREDNIMSLPEAVRKMSALPAEMLNLKDRGYLRSGYAADIVLFDPLTVIDNATWSDPHQYPTGIPYVIVNGEMVIDQEKYTGELPGRVLRG